LQVTKLLHAIVRDVAGQGRRAGPRAARNHSGARRRGVESPSLVLAN
jgi:hypothetical protein